MTPDDGEVRLTLPPDEDLVAVASVAVRAAGRQVALPEVEISRLRAAVEEELVRQAATATHPIEVVLRAAPGALSIDVGATSID